MQVKLLKSLLFLSLFVPLLFLTPLNSRKKIVIFGFAFKANTGDIRDSPGIFPLPTAFTITQIFHIFIHNYSPLTPFSAITIVERMVAERANVHVYDPKVRHSDIKALYKGVTCHDDPYEAAKDAHAILVLTDWEEVIFLLIYV